ncbi:hypothetical protein BaRGS_00030067, partial [Batillaria attramentaria]
MSRLFYAHGGAHTPSSFSDRIWSSEAFIAHARLTTLHVRQPLPLTFSSLVCDIFALASVQ